MVEAGKATAALAAAGAMTVMSEDDDDYGDDVNMTKMGDSDGGGDSNEQWRRQGRRE